MGVDNALETSHVVVQDEDIIVPPEFIETEEEPVASKTTAADVIQAAANTQAVDNDQADVQIQDVAEQINSDTSSSADATDKSVQVIEQNEQLVDNTLETEIEEQKSSTNVIDNNNDEPHADMTPTANVIVNTPNKEITTSSKDTTTTAITNVHS